MNPWRLFAAGALRPAALGELLPARPKSGRTGQRELASEHLIPRTSSRPDAVGSWLFAGYANLSERNRS